MRTNTEQKSFVIVLPGEQISVYDAENTSKPILQIISPGSVEKLAADSSRLFVKTTEHVIIYSLRNGQEIRKIPYKLTNHNAHDILLSPEGMYFVASDKITYMSFFLQNKC